jgi:uncharacterized protein with von Willebrand factor type A (vWA) domain
MPATLTSFIRALRNADVRISTAETLDAFNAVELVGYHDRAQLKHSLALVLSKTQDEKAAFDTCFDQFFSSRDIGSLQPPEGFADQPPRSSDDVAGESGNREGGGEGDEPRGAEDRGQQRARSSQARKDAKENTPDTNDPALVPGEISAPQSALGQLLTRGNQTEISVAINSAGQRVKVHEIEVFTQKGVYTRRIMEAMGLTDLQQEIAQLAESTSVPDRRLGHDLSRRRDWLRERVRDYVEHQFLLHADVTGRRLREDLLRNVRLAALDRRHQRIIQDIVLRMARRLVASYSRRRKVFRRGALNVPRTLRRNMKYDEAIFDLHWKSVRVDRPKVFAVCDVSGSVAQYAQFMLMFLYSLEIVLPKIRSFAFSSELGEVSELFAREKIEDAIALTLRNHGGGATDYGQAFADLRKLCLDEIDHRTTLIILGDARNNFGDPRTDVLKEFYERSRRVIWLNPEPRAMWNTGDSEMRHFGTYCHQVDECGTLQQLERVVSRLVKMG